MVKSNAEQPQGDIYHIHTDHLGTPQEVSNEAGEVIWAAQYRAYGAVKRQLKVAGSDVNGDDQPDPSLTMNLRFMGQYFDQETGLHYNRHRYYDPECGQFTTQDPIGLMGGLNNYQYVPNPVSWVDLLGLCEEYGISSGANSGLGLVELDPSLIRTTQTTVKQQGATIPKLVDSMKRDGFVVEPDRLIDVVRMPDGGLTSLDNTRILAAQRAGVNVQARVFEHTDLLPNDLDYISRFIGRRGEVPTTFGDAVKNRISNQNSTFRNLYPNGSPYIGSAF